MDAAAAALRDAIDAGGPGSVAVLGGARGTNEDAYAWAKLAKGVIGTDHVDAQLGDGLPAGAVFGLPGASIAEVCTATTVVLLGPDLKEELPVLYLRLRDAAEKRTIRILELSERDTGLTPYAWRSLRHRPGEQAALVRALVGSGPAAGLGVEDDAVAEIREQFGRGQVAAVVGRGNLASSSAYAVDAAAALLAAQPQARFLVALRRGNVRGALEMGLAPGLLPGRAALADASGELRAAWPLLPAQAGMDAAAILEAAANGAVGCLVLLGADPLADFPDAELARRALAGPAKVIALDTFLTASSSQADVVFAVAAFGEKTGTTTNLEGRVSPVAQKITAAGTAMEDWMVAVELAERLGTDLGLDSVAAIGAETVAVVGTGSSFAVTDSGAVPPTVNNYDFRLLVDRELYDSAVFTTRSPSMADLARGAAVSLNPWDADRRGFVDGTPVQVIAARATTVLPARPDQRVPRGVARIVFNQPGGTVTEVVDATLPINDVRLEPVDPR
jgi:NADH-quinone oxidoreductase subunit G